MGRRSANSNGPDVSIRTVAPVDFTAAEPSLQPGAFPDLAEEREILDNVNIDPLIDAASKPYAGVGRRPHDRWAIVRAHFLTYLHKTTIGTITALHWTLMNSATFRDACGFNSRVPSRSTLSKVFAQMAEHPEVVECKMDDVVREAKRIRPDLGEELVVDAERRLGGFPRRVLGDRGYDSERDSSE